MANQNENKKEIEGVESFDFDELESKLQEELEMQFSELDFLKEQTKQVGNPDALGDIVLNTIFEQVNNQIAVQAGQDFIKDNNGLNLDLRNEAHIQTTDNFAKGNIATHNTQIDYQKRYDDWQSNFQKDESGNVVTHKTRSGKEETTLVKGARDKYDANRPSGSADKHTDIDHTISAAEIIRDPEAAAHMTENEKINFANSDANLNEIDSSQNRSKGDKSTSEWLDSPNAKGQKPKEIFDISDDDEKKLRQKDKEAREEYKKQKEEAEKKSIEAGKKSQKEETFKIGKKAVRAIVMNLLSDLVKKIIRHLVNWIKNAKKNLKSLVSSIKDAIIEFITNLKEKVVSIADTAATVIATSILGPIVSTIKSAWMFIKQSWSSLKQAIDYLKDPVNKDKPFGIVTLEIGKIIMTGVTVLGAIVLGEVIEKGLMMVPGFTLPIPLLGSLANIIGIFMGAVVAGIIGALALNLINGIISDKLKKKLQCDEIDKKNEILDIQGQLLDVGQLKLHDKKTKSYDIMKNRHDKAMDIMIESLNIIKNNSIQDDDTIEHDNDFEYMDQQLDELLSDE